MTPRNRKARKGGPPMAWPHALERAYARALYPIAEACQRAVEQVFIPALGTYPLRHGAITDAISSDLGMVGRVATRAVIRHFDPKLLAELVSRRADEVDAFQRRQLTRRLANDLAIKKMGGLYTTAKTDKLVAEFTKANVELITSLPEKVFGQVERKVERAVRNGTRVETLRKDLMNTYDIGRAKADLLARDQVGKLYGQLNRTRQESIGIATYIWRTVGDERVRKTHADLDGELQDWSDPPVTNEDGDTNHPGEDYQCRCTAEPNLDELLEG